jgi:heat shock protein HtpX
VAADVDMPGVYEVTGRGAAPHLARGFRGGGQLVPVRGGWLGLGHEVAHIANGDMVTMTLIQGVINAFVMFFARVIGYAAANAMRSNNDDRPNYMVQYMVTMVLEIFLSFLGMIAVAAFSRWREYRADRGGADLAGRGNMIAALKALRSVKNSGFDPREESEGEAAVAAFKISSRRSSIVSLLSTHPDLDDRIAALEAHRGA